MSLARRQRNRLGLAVAALTVGTLFVISMAIGESAAYVVSGLLIVVVSVILILDKSKK